MYSPVGVGMVRSMFDEVIESMLWRWTARPDIFFVPVGSLSMADLATCYRAAWVGGLHKHNPELTENDGIGMRTRKLESPKQRNSSYLSRRDISISILDSRFHSGQENFFPSVPVNDNLH